VEAIDSTSRHPYLEDNAAVDETAKIEEEKGSSRARLINLSLSITASSKQCRSRFDANLLRYHVLAPTSFWRL
jgi:hypothetical protein